MKEHTIYLRLIPCGKFAKLGKYFRKSTRCLQFEISLTEKNVIRYDTLQADNIPVLSICASPRKGRYGDQCIEQIVELYRDRVPEIELASFDRLVRIWREYHLNDLTAGTQVQELALKEWKKQNKYDYSAARAYLKEIGLEDDRGFIYGTQWLARSIPQEDVAFLEELIVEWAEDER